MYISPRYLANIENNGQHPSLQIFFELMLRYHISVDQFLLDTPPEKDTKRLLKVVNSSCFPAEMPVNQGFWAIINLFCVTFLPKTSHPAFALELHRYSATHLVDQSTPVFRCNHKNHSDTKQAAEDDMHKIIPYILFMLSELSIFSLLRNRSH